MAIPLPPYSDYIIFVDESGSPTLSPVDPNFPIFVLTFCIVHKRIYTERIQPQIKKLKFDFFGHDMTVLHSHEIRKPRGEFSFLLDPTLRAGFIERLNTLLSEAEFHIVSHVIHKVTLARKYTRPFDPYHIALRMCMEQASLFLQEHGQHRKLTHIIVESRGKKEDAELELGFRRIIDPSCGWGMAHRFKMEETPFAIKFVEKKINSAGLQLADLAGHPIGRHILKPQQENRAYDIIKSKIWRNLWEFP